MTSSKNHNQMVWSSSNYNVVLHASASPCSCYRSAEDSETRVVNNINNMCSNKKNDLKFSLLTWTELVIPFADDTLINIKLCVCVFFLYTSICRRSLSHTPWSGSRGRWGWFRTETEVRPERNRSPTQWEPLEEETQRHVKRNWNVYFTCVVGIQKCSRKRQMCVTIAALQAFFLPSGGLCCTQKL